jgi:hypothetical protein
MTADNNAETFVGATGWASGSQLLRGMSPAFTANPKNESRKMAQRSASVTAGGASRSAEKPSPPVAPAIRMNAIATAMVPPSLIASMT